MPITKISTRCLTDFLNEELTQTQIAKACGITRQAVWGRINYRKTPQRNKRIRRQFAVVFLRRLGFTIKEIVKHTNYCETHIRKLLSNAGINIIDTNY